MKLGFELRKVRLAPENILPMRLVKSRILHSSVGPPMKVFKD